MTSDGLSIILLAQLLLKKEVVDRPELHAILNGVSIERAKERKTTTVAAESEEMGADNN